MPKADPKLSAGARLERAAMSRHLKRLLRSGLTDPPALDGYMALLQWLRDRDVRYNAKPGGLGKR